MCARRVDHDGLISVFFGYGACVMEVSVRLVGSAAFKAVGTSEPRPAGSIPVHLRQFVASRIRALLILALGFIAVVPPSAASADPAQPSNTESVVESVEPSTDAARVDIVGGDAFVRLRVARGHTVELRGYYDEPYVRVADDGTVSVNETSDTFRISKSRYGAGTTIDDGGSASIDESWVVSSTNGTYLWHDHRVHWMSPTTPRAIDGSGLVQQWSIPITVDGRATLVSGSLYLRDAPGAWWWLLAVPALVVGYALSRRIAPRELAAAGAVFAVIGAFMFWGLPSQARGAPGMFALGVLAVTISVATAVFRRRDEIVDALVTSAAVALVVAVVIERGTVTNRFVPGLGDSILVRLAVPLIAGLAIGTGARALKRLVGKPDASASA
ncbi:MAG: hypothetical protein RIQ64_1687 [Actinomycetota bacterium]